MEALSAANNSTAMPNGEQDSGFWETGAWILTLTGVIVTALGLIGNYLCYVTAGYLPESTSAYLMKYLAVWDSIAVLQDGIVNLGSKLADYDLSTISVRNLSSRKILKLSKSFDNSTKDH